MAADTVAPQRHWQAAEVRALLADIADPEIPVISIGELGVLRDVLAPVAGDGRFEVVITPTYSGCPAIEQIADDIHAALAVHQLSARITTRLAPAWTTDWLEPATLAKLRDYGIAAPAPGSAHALGGNLVQFAKRNLRPAADVCCPRCASINTTPTSHFGSTACKALYRCLDCLEPFDYFKPY